jgi:hypothetical protein
MQCCLMLMGEKLWKSQVFVMEAADIPTTQGSLYVKITNEDKFHHLP